jgi:predicted site-specific integrase-resolvase
MSQDYERQISDLKAYAQKQSYQVVEVITEVYQQPKPKHQTEKRLPLAAYLNWLLKAEIQKVLVSEFPD